MSVLCISQDHLCPFTSTSGAKSEGTMGARGICRTCSLTREFCVFLRTHMTSSLLSMQGGWYKEGSTRAS
ncbi:hypothetical protein ATCV1_z057L [Acanthocystis turfacea chlorella virus 1]|uniref:Uncharacterized protein z057L n=1 Tax=Chlorovirus heliozoae TaxID=322019 RepID=A7K817_9PHYC|nr:hypothetical protein ATCV1_z057L [Acanthocystis turfacea chlorella virus 1]ABT16191.1 hypothetical protein ATCV1_z057L [Acanthocystis turfacea chlorella virus 1]